MDSWNRLLTLLDQTLGFANKIRSTVKKKWQSFDQRTGEHVFLLEYRIKVKPGIYPPATPPKSPRDLHAKPPLKQATTKTLAGPMGTLRELMDVRFVHTEDSSPSSPSSKSGKRTTAKSRLRPRKPGANPPRSPIPPA